MLSLTFHQFVANSYEIRVAFAGFVLRDRVRARVRLQARVPLRAWLRPALRHAHLRARLASIMACAGDCMTEEEWKMRRERETRGRTESRGSAGEMEKTETIEQL